MTNSNIQLRGHCQVCGNVQAVIRGNTMSKHGYTREHGWFNGVCHGEHHQPIELSREYADRVIASISKECADLEKRIFNLHTGEEKPQTFQIWNSRIGKYETTPAGELNAYAYRQAINDLCVRIKNRIREGKFHVSFMEEMIEKFHGKPLIEVDRDNKPEQIMMGEKRVLEDGTIVEVKYVQGARVYFNYTNSIGKTITTWWGSRAWRGLEKVA